LLLQLAILFYFYTYMFFYLSKLLGFLFSPLSWVFILMIYSFKTHKEGRSIKLRIVSLVILYVCSNSFVVDECFRRWEPVTQDLDSTDIRYDGAIVLGGIGTVDQRQQKLIFTWGADRLCQVLPLYQSGRVKRIVFTGGSGSIEFPEDKEGIFVGKYLHQIGVPDSAVVIESNSKNTYENAVFTKKQLDSLQLNGRFLLVTSAYHLPRAAAVFRKAGFTNIDCYPTNRISGVRRFTFDHLFIPNANALFNLQFLIHEWLGYLTYKIKGYA
jgi:uncharacterized SAM-binding protein YcdF (DUF218 family)